MKALGIILKLESICFPNPNWVLATHEGLERLCFPSYFWKPYEPQISLQFNSKVLY